MTRWTHHVCHRREQVVIKKPTNPHCILDLAPATVDIHTAAPTAHPQQYPIGIAKPTKQRHGWAHFNADDGGLEPQSPIESLDIHVQESSARRRIAAKRKRDRASGFAYLAKKSLVQHRSG